jgi:CBS domain-containing protein
VVVLGPQDDAGRILDAMADAPDQPIFPVVADGKLVGLITGRATREIAFRVGAADIVAEDLMVPPVTVSATATLDEVARALLSHDLRALPVVDDRSAILGLIDEHDVSRAYLGRVAAVAA